MDIAVLQVKVMNLLAWRGHDRGLVAATGE